LAGAVPSRLLCPCLSVRLSMAALSGCPLTVPFRFLSVLFWLQLPGRSVVQLCNRFWFAPIFAATDFLPHEGIRPALASCLSIFSKVVVRPNLQIQPFRYSNPCFTMVFLPSHGFLNQTSLHLCDWFPFANQVRILELPGTPDAFYCMEFYLNSVLAEPIWFLR
jgi:hypothetical protein